MYHFTLAELGSLQYYLQYIEYSAHATCYLLDIRGILRLSERFHLVKAEWRECGSFKCSRCKHVERTARLSVLPRIATWHSLPGHQMYCTEAQHPGLRETSRVRVATRATTSKLLQSICADHRVHAAMFSSLRRYCLLMLFFFLRLQALYWKPYCIYDKMS